MDRILLVEDDEAIAEPLVRALTREGFALEHVTSGEDALELLGVQRFAAVILDIGLPGISGIEVCQQLRRRGSGIGVLMLTARSTELDEVLGLDAGADDYVVKPFRLAVLIARLRALLRREQPGTGPAVPITTGDLVLDPSARMAARGDRTLELSPKEFDLLAYLAARPGQAVRREEIMSGVRDENWWGSTKTLDVHIGWLRHKLGDPPLITTVRGYGFRIEA